MLSAQMVTNLLQLYIKPTTLHQCHYNNQEFRMIKIKY